MNIYLIVPSYNEGKRLRDTLKHAKKYFPEIKTVVVDDGSIRKELLSPTCKAILIRHQLNLGKGAAMITGADYAFSQGAEAVIFMDADSQHNPKQLKDFKRYLEKDYDLVFGSRDHGIHTPLIRFLGNRFASVYINILFGVYVSDILSGYRALTKKAYNLVKWRSVRYGVETEMVARLGKHKNKLSWIEFPIDTIYVDKYKGVTIVDAIKILGQSIWWKLS